MKNDYGDTSGEIYRVSIRGIIFVAGKLLLIENSFGEVKLPGGGMEPGEDDCQALAREVKEETGYTENEKKYGSHQVFYTVEEALEKNERMLEKEGRQAWNQREYKTLLLIRDHLDKEHEMAGKQDPVSKQSEIDPSCNDMSAGLLYG